MKISSIKIIKIIYRTNSKFLLIESKLREYAHHDKQINMGDTTIRGTLHGGQMKVKLNKDNVD